MNFGLPEKTLRTIHNILSQHAEVDQAILYGSRAKGNHKPGSDIDLTLVGGDALTLPIMYRIATELDDSTIPYTVDLSIFHQIGDSDVKEHIQRMGIVFFDKSDVNI
jgi:predicted nucleotidyltransferase